MSFIPMASADVQQGNARQVSRYGLSDAEWLAGRKYMTKRGDKVRSLGEVRVANHLLARGLQYEYEPMICGWRPDFFLPEYGIIIEYWSSLSRNRPLKTKSYLRAGYTLVSLDSEKPIAVEKDIDRQLYYKFKALGLKYNKHQ